MTLFMFRILSLFAIWFCLSVTSLSGGVVISEFLASNSGGFATAEGGHSDWIELQNQGEATVALGGYGLTDDPENPLKWTLPAAELAAGDHVVVFASGDDVSVLEEEWHTNFRLAKSGGYCFGLAFLRFSNLLQAVKSASPALDMACHWC